jgi:Sec7-like guanine-nucleotide exchange factor
VIELNGTRSLEILNIFWSELRDYYIELGRHKNEMVALFASDFLKQIVTKFLKKKDLIVLQKEYLKPFEEIFQTSKSFPVKELMIGGLNYFVHNHHSGLKSGWRVILSVVSSSF